MLEPLTKAQKNFERNTRNSMFARVVFLEPVSGTHWITKIQRQTQQ